MKKHIRQSHAIISFAILGALSLLGGGAAIGSHLLLRPVSSDAELGALSIALLATGLIFCSLAALCLMSAWMLFKHTSRASVLATVTLLLLVVAWLWDLLHDIQTGVSIAGLVGFVLDGLLLSVIALYLRNRAFEKDAEPNGAANRSQPIRAKTNRTSVTAGSDRSTLRSHE